MLHLARTCSRVGWLSRLLLMLSLHSPSVLAAQDKGLTSDTSYESPYFGYDVGWSDSWAAVKGETLVSEGLDLLALVSDEDSARVDVDSTLAKSRTP